MSLTEMVSSLIWRSRRMTSRCRKLFSGVFKIFMRVGHSQQQQFFVNICPIEIQMIQPSSRHPCLRRFVRKQRVFRRAMMFWRYT